MGKQKHVKVEGFESFSYEAEIHAVPKTYEKGISIVRESVGKHKHFKFMGFLNISGEAQILIIPKTWET